jgi:threonine synthase
MLTAAFRSSSSANLTVAKAVYGGCRPLSLTSSFSRWFTAEPEDHHADEKKTNNIAEEGGADFGESVEPSMIIPRRSHSQKTLDELPITFADISRAEVAIRGGVKRTTCERSHFISELVGANVYFKNEFRQFTGSFKERGARNAILKLMREKGTALRGVIAASAGNHALALAYHGQLLGVPVTVVMPTVAPLAKVDKCRVRSLTLIVVVVACCILLLAGRHAVNNSFEC